MALADLSIYAASRIHSAQIATVFKWRDWVFATSQLPFDMQPQTESNWCWAATATSTSLFYRSWSTWTQCTVACTTLNRSDCCNDPVPDECNVPWFLTEALTTTDNFVSFSGPVSYSAVEAEIAAGRVLGARIGWHDGGGHFMVIYGCSTVNGVQYLNIDDPIFGKSNPSLDTFSNNYQGAGSWTTTYYTKAPRLVLKLPPFEVRPDLLDKIRQVRPLLLRQADPARFEEKGVDEDVSFALAHPVHVLGLRQLVKEGPVLGAPAAIRLFETKDNAVQAYYDLSPDPASPAVMQMASRDNDYAALFERGLSVASRFTDDAAGSRNAKPAGRKAEPARVEWTASLLRIPALYTEAIVLTPDRGEAMAVVIRSPQKGVTLFRPIPLKELSRLLQGPARAMLADDDDLKGS